MDVDGQMDTETTDGVIPIQQPPPPPTCVYMGRCGGGGGDL